MTRQHHCRACGQVFCSKCSAKACPIPKFGIEKEVKNCQPFINYYALAAIVWISFIYSEATNMLKLIGR